MPKLCFEFLPGSRHMQEKYVWGAGKRRLQAGERHFPFKK